MEPDKIQRIRKYQYQRANGKKWCYDCENFYEAYACGYSECCCKKFGSIDIGQRERHPDITADTCPEYIPANRPPWFIQDLTVEEAFKLKLIKIN